MLFLPKRHFKNKKNKKVSKSPLLYLSILRLMFFQKLLEMAGEKKRRQRRRRTKSQMNLFHPWKIKIWTRDPISPNFSWFHFWFHLSSRCNHNFATFKLSNERPSLLNYSLIKVLAQLFHNFVLFLFPITPSTPPFALPLDLLPHSAILSILGHIHHRYIHYFLSQELHKPSHSCLLQNIVSKIFSMCRSSDFLISILPILLTPKEKLSISNSAAFSFPSCDTTSYIFMSFIMLTTSHCPKNPRYNFAFGGSAKGSPAPEFRRSNSPASYPGTTHLDSSRLGIWPQKTIYLLRWYRSNHHHSKIVPCPWAFSLTTQQNIDQTMKQLLRSKPSAEEHFESGAKNDKTACQRTWDSRWFGSVRKGSYL